MLDSTYIENSVAQNTPLEKNEVFVDAKGGVISSIKALQHTVVEWRDIQSKANDKLYFVLSGCLQIIYMCENRDLYTALISLCEHSGMKNMDEKSISLCVSKLVFGSTDKKCYTYSKALENAKSLKLQTEDNEQSLSTYLKMNGGIDKLIRKEAIGISKGYKDERFGTEEHFGEEVIYELLERREEHRNILKGLQQKRTLTFQVDNEDLHKQFTEYNNFTQYAKLHYNYETKTMDVFGYTLDKNTIEYDAVDKLWNKFIGKTFRKNSKNAWNKYIKMCDKRNEFLKKEEEKKIEQLLQNTKL